MLQQKKAQEGGAEGSEHAQPYKMQLAWPELVEALVVLAGTELLLRLPRQAPQKVEEAA